MCGIYMCGGGGGVCGLVVVCDSGLIDDSVWNCGSPTSLGSTI